MSKTAKKLFIKTWGCQMNVYDSRRMSDILRPLGYQRAETAEEADMVILNTCHIREKATEKVFSEIGRLRDLKEEKKAKGKNMLIAVAGCVAQAEGDVIMDRAPSVDMVFGPQTYHELPEMVLRAGAERVVNTEFPANTKFDSLPADQDQGVTAFISIQEGCDKFCTFCVVPYTRGSEYSRPAASIIEETKRLADKGTKEVTLLGQNVNAYHGEANGRTWGLGRLMAELAEIKGIERLRYMTSHPRDMDQELIDAHRDIPTVMPFLHLPVQSGSDKILKIMNRKHTADEYRDIIERMKRARPDIAFSSDFIVGFPGETDEDFEDTLNLVRGMSFASSYSFKYSARPGTPAANMTGLVHEKLKDERLKVLQDLLFSQQLNFNQNSVGLTLPVLFDRKGQRQGQIHGKTPYNQSVSVQAPERLLTRTVGIRITKATASSLAGEPESFETVVKSA